MTKCNDFLNNGLAMKIMLYVDIFPYFHVSHEIWVFCTFTAASASCLNAISVANFLVDWIDRWQRMW